MKLKQASDEIRALAQTVGNLPGGGIAAAETMILAADTLMATSSRVGSDNEGAAYIKEKLTPFRKGSAYWSPPHNLAFNETLTGTWNLWVFTILPLFPAKQAYSSGSGRRPEGIVIQPNWKPHGNKAVKFTVDMAKKAVGAAKNAPTVQDTVRKELAWIEQQFGITIPNSIKSKLNGEAQKTAGRRWGVKRIGMKKTLIPFDGSKPVNI